MNEDKTPEEEFDHIEELLKQLKEQYEEGEKEPKERKPDRIKYSLSPVDLITAALSMNVIYQFFHGIEMWATSSASKSTIEAFIRGVIWGADAGFSIALALALYLTWFKVLSFLDDRRGK
jgi:hypothetical protein